MKTHLAIATCIAALVCLEWTEMNQWLGPTLAADWQRFSSNARTLVDADEYYTAMQAQAEKVEAQYHVPELVKRVDSQSIDFFGVDVSLPIINQLYYTPRPVFHSYAAYTKRLARLNDLFYAQTPPQFVLAEVHAVDNHFAPLEDPLTMRHLLQEYTLDANFGAAVLLKRSPVPVSLRIETDYAGVGTTPVLKLPLNPLSQRSVLYLKCEPLHTHPIRRLFYQDKPIEVSVRGGQKFTCSPAMLKTGFVLHPLILTTTDLSDYYQGKFIQGGITFSEPMRYTLIKFLAQ